MKKNLVFDPKPSRISVGACGLWRRRLPVAIGLCLLAAGAILFAPDAAAQTTWQKMKMNILQQQCQQGMQKACQSLAEMKQKLAQQGGQQAGQSGAQQTGAQQTGPQQTGSQQSGSQQTGAQTQAPAAADVIHGDAAAGPAAANTDVQQGSGSQAAWSPNEDATPSKPAGPLDPMKLPDIQGIHPGMTVAQATQVITKAAPGTRIPWYNSPMLIPTSSIVVGHAASQVTVQYDWVEVGGGAKNYRLELSMEATRPPNQEHVWHIGLRIQLQHINRAVLLEAMRKKYGKELFATDMDGQLIHDDSRINNLWWAFDEQGHPKSPAPALVNGTPNGCGEPGYGLTSLARYGSGGGTASSAGKDSAPGCMWVGVHASIPSGAGEIISYYFLSLWDAPLSVREFKATDAWLDVQLEKARQESLQKSKEAKPTL